MDSEEGNFPSQGNVQKLSAAARMAYDKNGHLDRNRFQLLARGSFLSQEEAAALPTHLSLPTRTSADISAQKGSQVAPRAKSISTTVTGDQSDREFWADEKIMLLIQLHASRVPFPEIAKCFPGKSQKACQEKYYHTINKDGNYPNWRQHHDDLRREHDATRKQEEAGGRGM